MSPVDVPDPEDLQRVRTQDLLDFALLYESDRAGPGLRSITEYQRLFPRIAGDIGREFARLAGAAGSSLERSAPPRGEIDHYRLERELGHGGQGRVYLAFDPRMRRRVALKLLNRASVTPDKLRRFQREVEVIAKLDHPGLCAVYEARLDGPRPYLVMRYVEGDDLARRLAARRAHSEESTFIYPEGPVELARLLQLFERAARALHAAHESGVVHRDVKPANILVRRDGDPVIVDFGLARANDAGASLTVSGDVFGTPAYMAPELIRGGHAAVDRRSDVYALGVALYECLTLQRPFQDDAREAMFQQILRGAYRSPRELNRQVGEDLRVVLATAMEVDPARRYASALEFAEDLRRVREYEPIRARPAGLLLRLRRWSQRHPRIAAATVIAFAALGAWALALRLTLNRVEEQRRLLAAANERLRGVSYREQSAAQRASNPGYSLALAIEAARLDPGFDSNMAVLGALGQCRERRTFGVPTSGAASGLDVTRDGTRVVVANRHGHVLIYRIADARLLANVAAGVTSAEIQVQVRTAPDSASLVVFGQVQRPRVHDASTGELLFELDCGGAVPASVEFSGDGRWLLTSAGDGVARLHDARDGRLLRQIAPGLGYMTQARFDAAGQSILTSADFKPQFDLPEPTDRNPRVWSAATGEWESTLEGHTRPIRDACFAPDGRLIVTADIDGQVRGFERSSGRLSWSAMLPGQSWVARFSPDSRAVAVGFDPGARVFDAATGAVRYDLEGFADRSVVQLEFSPDGRWIAAQDYGGNVGAWRASDGGEHLRSRVVTRALGALAWLPDSRAFVTCSGAHTCHLWSLAPIPYFFALSVAGGSAHQGSAESAVFDPASRSVVTAGADGAVRVWSALDGGLEQEFQVDLGPLRRVWCIGDGRALGGLAESGAVAVLQRPSGEWHAVAPPAPSSITAVAVSASGDQVAYGSGDGRVHWIATPSGQVLAAVQPTMDGVRRLALSPDQAKLAWSSSGGDAGWIERGSGRQLRFRALAWREMQSEIFGLGFTSDGRELLTSADDNKAHIWRTEDGEYLGDLSARIFGEVVSLRGNRRLLATAKWTPDVVLYSGESWRRQWESSGRQIDGPADILRASPDEKYFLYGGRNGVLELARVSDGVPVQRYRHRPSGAVRLTCAEFSPDGRAIVTAAEDGSVRLWPVEVVETARAYAPADLAGFGLPDGNPDPWNK